MNPLGEWFQKHVVVEYSPFLETLSSLHVVARPEHHLERLAWAQMAKGQLPPSLLQSILHFGHEFDFWLNVMDIRDQFSFEEASVEEGIEKLSQIEDSDFAFNLLGRDLPKEQIDRWLGGDKINDSQLIPVQLELLRRPATFKRGMVETLYDYYRGFFSRELRRVEPWLTRFVHSFQEKLDKDPVKAMASIHPRFVIHERELLFLKAHTWRFTFAEIEKLLVHPSTFISPHLLLGVYLPKISVGCHVSVPGLERSDSVPKDLLAVMDAMSDATRMKILRQLFYHPYCTQQLAGMYGLAEATVSKHLKVLSRAGLVRSERRGNFVFYSGIRDRIQMIRVDIDQFFDQPLLEQKRKEEEK